MPEKRFFVYILAKGRNSTFYVGLTTDLPKRVAQHKQGWVEGFTRRYGVNKLVYYEAFDSAENAIKREKSLKKWNRPWKMRIIEELNPDWRDLFEDICN